MHGYLTSEMHIALNHIFDFMGESRFNRTAEEYLDIIRRLPPLKRCHGIVNDRLREIAKSGTAPYEICPFRAGDQSVWYKPYPTSLSLETVRLALVLSGMRPPRQRRGKSARPQEDAKRRSALRHPRGRGQGYAG
jgi:hypothetical protein